MENKTYCGLIQKEANRALLNFYISVVGNAADYEIVIQDSTELCCEIQGWTEDDHEANLRPFTDSLDSMALIEAAMNEQQFFDYLMALCPDLAARNSAMISLADLAKVRRAEPGELVCAALTAFGAAKEGSGG